MIGSYKLTEVLEAEGWKLEISTADYHYKYDKGNNTVILRKKSIFYGSGFKAIDFHKNATRTITAPNCFKVTYEKSKTIGLKEISSPEFDLKREIEYFFEIEGISRFPNFDY